MHDCSHVPCGVAARRQQLADALEVGNGVEVVGGLLAAEAPVEVASGCCSKRSKRSPAATRPFMICPSVHWRSYLAACSSGAPRSALAVGYGSGRISQPLVRGELGSLLRYHALPRNQK